jgi:hypothetical protein
VTRSEQAVLSTIVTSVEDLTDRITTLAEELAANDDAGDAAAALFEAERALRVAARNLGRATRALR